MSLSILYPSTGTISPVVDIVAVHGLGGDAITTWTHTKSGKFWLKDFLPQQIPDARIMTFGYNADVALVQSTAEVTDHAKSLLSSLVDKREEPEEIQRPLVFIAHSLGGIVVKKALLQARLNPLYLSISKQTLGLIFMGTPHRGSEKATYGEVLANIAQFVSRRPPARLLSALQTNSNFLLDLTTDFRFQLPDYEVYSFFELRPMKGLTTLIVEKYSALLDTSHEEQIPVDADHRAMCKFETEEDATFEKVYKRIRRIVQRPRNSEIDILDKTRASGGTNEAPTESKSARLFAAIENHDHQALKLALSDDLDVDYQDDNGQTALHKAVLKDRECMIQELLNCEARLDVKDNDGSTPLDLTANSAFPSIVRLTQEAALRTNAIPGSTSLHKSAFYGIADEIRSSLQQGADANQKDIYGATALHYAVFGRNVEVVDDLLAAGVDPNVSARWWGTPLHKAAYAGLQDICVRLLRAGADIDAVKPGTQWTALGLAIYAQHAKLGALLYLASNHGGNLFPAIEARSLRDLQLLLYIGKDSNISDAYGQTPLHKAVLQDNAEMVHELLEHNSRLNVRDHNGKTPLDLACDRAHSHIVHMMFKKALLSNQIEGSTPLHRACFFGDRSEVQRLLGSGADASTKDIYGATPLHYSIFGRDDRIVQDLIHQGTNIDAECYHWGTALHKAAFVGMKAVVTLLMQAGASINAIKPRHRWTPLGVAIFNGHNDLAVYMQNLALDQGRGWVDSHLLNATEREIVPRLLQTCFVRSSIPDHVTYWVRRETYQQSRVLPPSEPQRHKILWSTLQKFRRDRPQSKST